MQRDSLFSLSQSNKQTKQDFEKLVRLAKENAEKGRFAVKIQRQVRGLLLRGRLRRQAWQEWAPRLKDIGKVLELPKVRAVFFLPIDKFVPLVVGVANGIDGRLVARGFPGFAELGAVVGVLAEVFRCGENFTDAKVVVNNLVYNFLTGHRRARWAVWLLVRKLRRLAAFLAGKPGASPLLEKLWGLFAHLADIAKIKAKLPEASLLEPVSLAEYLALLRGLLPLLLPHCCCPLPDSPGFALSSDLAEVVLYTKGFKPKAALRLAGDSSLKLLGAAVAPRDQAQLERLCLLAFDPEAPANPDLVLFALDAILEARRSQIAFSRGAELGSFFLRSIIQRQSELESASAPQSETQTDLGAVCDALAEFLLKASLDFPADDLLVTLYTSFKNDDDFLRKLIHVSFKALRPVLSLGLASTAISLPSAADEAWLHLILGSLKYRMLTCTCEEFLSIGPNLDKILHTLFYLQNLFCYEHMLGGLPRPKAVLLARLASEVAKQMLDYNLVKPFFDPARLQMCRLNTFLYETVSGGVDRLEQRSFEHLYSLLCHFPGSFPFASRLGLFYKALPGAAASAVYARVRRDFLVEDARRLVEALLKSGATTAKVKIAFVDELGTVEEGHDDGGLFKEFLVLALHKVAAAHTAARPQARPLRAFPGRRAGAQPSLGRARGPGRSRGLLPDGLSAGARDQRKNPALFPVLSAAHAQPGRPAERPEPARPLRRGGLQPDLQNEADAPRGVRSLC